jgi:hypothetical protein
MLRSQPAADDGWRGVHRPSQIATTRQYGEQTIHRNAWDLDALPELVALESARAPWLDQLVELHVLSEHGDTTATEAAGRWMSTDSEARRVWDEVQRSCDQVRAAGGTSASV